METKHYIPILDISITKISTDSFGIMWYIRSICTNPHYIDTAKYFKEPEFIIIWGDKFSNNYLSFIRVFYEECDTIRFNDNYYDDIDKITNIEIKQIICDDDIVINREPKEFRPSYDKLNNIQKKVRAKTNRKHKRKRRG